MLQIKALTGKSAYNKAFEFAHTRRGPDAQKRRAAQLSRYKALRINTGFTLIV